MVEFGRGWLLKRVNNLKISWEDKFVSLTFDIILNTDMKNLEKLKHYIHMGG